MMDWYWSGAGAWGWLLMTVFWIAVIALAVAVVVRLFPREGQRPAPYGDQGSRATALEILDQRFARGEIDTDEYLRARETLHANAK